MRRGHLHLWRVRGAAAAGGHLYGGEQLVCPHQQWHVTVYGYFQQNIETSGGVAYITHAERMRLNRDVANSAGHVAEVCDTSVGRLRLVPLRRFS